MNDFVNSIILGIVEGVTEFLPISSTGHLIIVNRFIDFTGKFANTFDVVIQLGAILSVVVYFWKRLFPFGAHVTPEQRKQIFTIWFKAAAGVIPALMLGSVFGSIIEEKLFNPITVSIALVVGGIVMIYLENRKRDSKINSISELTYKTAFAIGFIQCLAMIPGTSRSAATIIGAMFLGASRLVAAEFSFFLAIPTMVAASAYSLLKAGGNLSQHEIGLLVTGFIVSFIVALAVIAVFMRYITRHDFKPFAYYRIALGIAVLGYFFLNGGT
jgi:undecaprenyl-diphosphatase